MSNGNAQEKIEVKQGDYEQGFTVIHECADEVEAVKKAKTVKKLPQQIVMVTRGAQIAFCRY